MVPVVPQHGRLRYLLSHKLVHLEVQLHLLGLMNQAGGILVRKVLLVSKPVWLFDNRAIHFLIALLIQKMFSNLSFQTLDFFQLAQISRYRKHQLVHHILGVTELVSILHGSVVTVSHHLNMEVVFVVAAQMGAQRNCLIYDQRHSLQQQQSTKSWSQVLRPSYCKPLKYLKLQANFHPKKSLQIPRQ